MRRGPIVGVALIVLLLGGAAAVWMTGSNGPELEEARAEAIPVREPVAPEALPKAAEPVAENVPTIRTAEEKRFARADRDDDGRIDRDEYLTTRRRNFDRLDANHDGRLSFEEYAKSGIDKFAGADRDHSGGLDAGEFATLAPVRRVARAADCPPGKTAVAERADSD
jgi:hypothetical protein